MAGANSIVINGIFKNISKDIVYGLSNGGKSAYTFFQKNSIYCPKY
jgi:hypothetical protein